MAATDDTPEIDIDNRDVYWMKEAVKIANIGLRSGEVPVGAVFVDAETD